MVASRNGHRQGFTLIELLAVMAIMGALLVVAVAGFVDAGRDAGMRSAVQKSKSALTFARQYAITHRQRTAFNFGNVSDNGVWQGYYSVSNTVDGYLTNTNYLPRGIVFCEEDSLLSGGNNDVRQKDEDFIVFKLEGRLAEYAGDIDEDARYLRIVEWDPGTDKRRGTGATEGLATTIKVMTLTGRVRVIRED